MKASVNRTASAVNTPINGLKSNCSERLTNHGEAAEGCRGLTANSQKSMDCNHERAVDTREQTEGGFGKCGDRPREESWSDYSSSSDSSGKSLDELQADLLNTDLTDMTDNMDLVFNDDSNLGDSLGW